ncbi:hypothetical protein [Neisseria sp. Ec49-e6-T10]|uniref:hypothetical protein n=1 Tax=Neisseria sp. Ec49-e6-T10 TaxID=3140744 RepID=UPI003EB91509
MMPERIKAVGEVIKSLPELFKVVVSKWWGAFAISFVIVVSTACAIVFINIDHWAEIRLQDQNKQNFIARFDESKFNVEISTLVKNSKAASASVWVVDVGSNTKRLLYRYISESGKEDKIFYNEDFPLFYFDENAIAFNRLIRKNITCLNLIPETNYGDQLAKEGISYVCFAPVPPESGQFIGLIELEFKSKPDELIKSEEQNNPAKRVTFENRLKKASRNIVKK